MLLKQSTARNRVVLLIDSADHVSGKAGLTLAIKASKDGAAFATITPTVTELEAGFYALALTSGHTDTLGDLALHVTGTGADPTDIVDQVMVDLPGATVASVTGAVGSVTGNVGGVATGGISAASFAAGAINAAAIATDAIDADALAADAVTEMQSGLSTLNAAGVRTAVGLASADLDTQIGTLATAANLATVAGYLDTEIAAILADTNELQTDWVNGGRLDSILDARASQSSVDDLPTNAELASALGAADDAVLAQVALVKAVTDKVDDTLEDDAGTYRFTANALEQAPTGGTAPTAVAIADEVQTRTIAAVTIVNGLAANTITAAALAADAGAEIAAAVNTATMTESYAASAAAMTQAQALHMIWALLRSRALVSTTLTSNKLDNTTPAMTFALDDATTPTAQERAT